MSTPHEVARDLRERMESAKRAASNPEAGSVYAFEYLLSACEAACARLDTEALLHPDTEALVTYAREQREQKRVSDAEAESVAGAACGAPVDSHVSRAYVGPGPARLAARFPIHKRGGR